MPAYENERNRRLTAAQSGASLYNAGQDRTLQGVGLFGDMNNQTTQNAQRTMALLPGLFNYGMQPGQSMLDIGGMYEGLAGNYLQEDVSRYNAPYQNAWSHLQNYAGLMLGLPDFSGSSQTTNGPGTNRVMSGLGGAATGAGLASALGMTGWGAPLAIGGGLLGLFG